MSKILLVITTYNESEYTKSCFDSLKTIEDDVDVLVIDDCSTDDTVDLCKEYGYENNIPPHEIADISNLQFIPAIENHRKSQKYEEIRNN